MFESGKPDPFQTHHPSGRASRGKEWYAEGLRFECTQCGNCCTGPPGAVWFSEREAKRMADFLDLAPAQFYRRHARMLGRKWTLKERSTEHGYDCEFLDRESVPGRAVCSLYDARPDQCRTWPFWRENLESEGAWETAKRETPCPGMNAGPLIPVEEIRVIRE